MDGIPLLWQYHYTTLPYVYVYLIMSANFTVKLLKF